jgi:UDP-N-acetylglucosamine diphosphorylase / glucose-1-phosphate thymidylyltransferase / UDP-N-acetylgalactosamine diphosphorylase / glucosamine-1-phosphate N-acetyltransferase / galactosamine-1-phosphate N-acetyltransferase
MIKKVVIAAAGQGTRMLELSKDKSKHLIEVKNRPFLSYVLDRLIVAGYYDIILVVGFKEELMERFKKEFVENYLKNSQHDLKIEIVDQNKVLGPKEKIYGTACPLMCVKDKIKNENFIYLYGDNLFSVKDLKTMNIDDEFCYIAGLKHENPEKYGVLIRDGEDFLEKIIEKPKEFAGNLINAGLYKFTPEVFGKLDKIEKSPRGEFEITDTISLLAKEKKVKIRQIEDYWLDFGNPADIEKVEEFLKEHGNS